MVLNEDKYEQFRLDCYNLKAGKITLNQIVNCTNGKGLTTQVSLNKPAPTSFVVKIIVDELNVRTGPGVTYDKVSTVKQGDAYTIVSVQNGWGKIKSGAGWINISSKYVTKL